MRLMNRENCITYGIAVICRIFGIQKLLKPGGRTCRIFCFMHSHGIRTFHLFSPAFSSARVNV